MDSKVTVEASLFNFSTTNSPREFEMQTKVASAFNLMNNAN